MRFLVYRRDNRYDFRGGGMVKRGRTSKTHALLGNLVYGYIRKKKKK